MLSLVDGGNVWTGLGMWQTMDAFGFVVCHHNKNTGRHINIVCCIYIPSPVHTFPSSTNDNIQYEVGDTLGHNYIYFGTHYFIVTEYLYYIIIPQLVHTFSSLTNANTLQQTCMIVLLCA